MDLNARKTENGTPISHPAKAGVTKMVEIHEGLPIHLNKEDKMSGDMTKRTK